MPRDLLRIAYVSRNALELETNALMIELDSILETSQARNRAVGVCGALMFNLGVFIQVLEGPADAVEATFNRIQCDPRHRDVTVLELETITSLSFRSWAMGFVGADADGAAAYARIGAQSGFDALADVLPELQDKLKRMALRNELRRSAA